MCFSGCTCARATPPAQTKEPDLGRTVGKYSDIVNEIREAGPGPTTTCLTQPRSMEEQKDWLAFRQELERDQDFETKRRRRMTLAELATTSHLEDEVSARIDDKAVVRGTAGLSPVERTIFFYGAFQSEVQNGGLHQFFANSTGNCALQTRAALHDIGATELLAVYDKALAVFPSPPSEDRGTRLQQMARVPNEFDAWEEEKVGSVDFDAKARAALERYVRAHLRELVLPPL